MWKVYSMAQISADVVNVIVARMLSTWSSSTRKLISIDCDTYVQFFHFLTVEHTVHDTLNSNTPILVVFNRETAIKQVSAHYRMALGKNFRAPHISRTLKR